MSSCGHYKIETGRGDAAAVGRQCQHCQSDVHGEADKDSDVMT